MLLTLTFAIKDQSSCTTNVINKVFYEKDKENQTYSEGENQTLIVSERIVNLGSIPYG